MLPGPRNIEKGGFVWQNSGVGGTTLQYFTNSPRAFPISVDDVWPITYQELIPYYEKVESTLPVSTAPATPKENIFYYGAKNAGWNEIEGKDVTQPGYRSQPNAILPPYLLLENREYDPKSTEPIGCTLRGHCVNGCHIGRTIDGVAKRSTFVSYIPLALATGNVEVRPNAFAVKILTKEDQDRKQKAVGVIYRNTWSGEFIELRANVIVMAGGAIETPRLWLNSQLPENPWVGKGLVNHWFDSVSGIFDEDDLMNTLGVPEIRPYVGQNAAARFDYPGLGVVETYGISPGLYSSMVYGVSGKGYSFLNPTNSEVPWDIEGMVVGEQLKEFMRNYPRTLSALIFTDDQVNQRNSVTLDPELKDENGFYSSCKLSSKCRRSRKKEKN